MGTGLRATAQGPFAIRQIADETQLNRAPVISETGLIAWYAFRIGPDAPQATEIYIHQNGETRSLTGGIIENNAGNNDPQVFSNSVVWVTTFSQNTKEPTWVLVDPLIVEGDIPEIDSRYRAYAGPDEAGGGPGRQWFEPVGTTNTFTHDLEGEEGQKRPPRRNPSGNNEIALWDGAEARRITGDTRNDLGPSIGENMLAWQKARGWPFGWEIMVWADGERMQLTTNFFYDMAPRVHNGQVAWYGWDGNDYEIKLYDHARRETIQITDNQYDDVSPQLWDGVIVWEAHPSISSDVYMWRDGETIKLSEGVEDDLNPRLWNGQVVWQSFDGDFFQIYHYDGVNTIRLTNSRYDNVNPDIRDGIITWMGYVDNMDAEIMAWTGGPDPIQLTDNEYEDHRPKTAGGRIVWRADFDGKSHVYVAEPQ